MDYHGFGRALKSAEIKEHLKNWEFSGCEVLHISIANFRECYVAYKLPNSDKVHAAVALIRSNNSREIYFKIIGETAGPYYYNAPKKMLKMLSPTEVEYAKEWRKECMKKFKRK